MAGVSYRRWLEESRTRVTLSLLAHQAALLPVPIPLLLRLALVVQLLALGQSELDLGDPPLVEIDLERHDRHAVTLDGAEEAGDLACVQQQLARPGRCMTVAGGAGVFGDMGVDEIELAAFVRGVRLGDVGPSRPQRLHLGALERDARFEFLLDVVVEARLPVLGAELAALALRRHDVPLPASDGDEADRRQRVFDFLARSWRKRRKRKARVGAAKPEL